MATKRKDKRPEPAHLNVAQAARYLGVSKTFFEEQVRPYIAHADLRAPGSKKPMPRWLPADLDEWVASRRRKPTAAVPDAKSA